MISATVVVSDPADPASTVMVKLSVGTAYGATPELAHEVLLVCLAAEWPTVVAVDGEVWSIAPGSLKALITQYE